MRIVPFFFRTATTCMLAHHKNGSSTLKITPMDSIHWPRAGRALSSVCRDHEGQCLERTRSCTGIPRQLMGSILRQWHQPWQLTVEPQSQEDPADCSWGLVKPSSDAIHCEVQSFEIVPSIEALNCLTRSSEVSQFQFLHVWGSSQWACYIIIHSKTLLHGKRYDGVERSTGNDASEA